MFVNLVHFPVIREGKDAEFQEWFARSNRVFAQHQGFVSRRLLRPQDGGNYAAIVEFESYETFTAMHNSAVHAQAHREVAPLFDGVPNPSFYDVIVT